MEQDRAGPRKIQEDEMDTSGHGDKLQAAVDKVAEPSDEKPGDSSTQVPEDEMDTSGHGDPKRRLLSSDS